MKKIEIIALGVASALTLTVLPVSAQENTEATNLSNTPQERILVSENQTSGRNGLNDAGSEARMQSDLKNAPTQGRWAQRGGQNFGRFDGGQGQMQGSYPQGGNYGQIASRDGRGSADYMDNRQDNRGFGSRHAQGFDRGTMAGRQGFDGRGGNPQFDRGSMAGRRGFDGCNPGQGYGRGGQFAQRDFLGANAPGRNMGGDFRSHQGFNGRGGAYQPHHGTFAQSRMHSPYAGGHHNFRQNMNRPHSFAQAGGHRNGGLGSHHGNFRNR